MLIERKIEVRKNGKVLATAPGQEPATVIDLSNFCGRPRYYAIGVDDAEILGSWESLEEAIAAARNHLEDNDPWKIDLELQDGKLNPLHDENGSTAIFLLFEKEEDEEDVPEEIEWRPVEGAPWEDQA